MASSPEIFISYRRDDSAGYAGRICDHLSEVFGTGHVFMDVDDIRPGDNFETAIRDRIGQCNLVLALIGPRWVETLQQRKDAPEDFVRREIGSALERNIPVIPVLIRGARVPSSSELTPELKPLSRRQGFVLRDEGFAEDLKRLIRAIQSQVGGGSGVSRRIIIAASVTLPLAAGAGGWLLWKVAHPRLSVAGTWRAVMQKKGQRPYRIRLELTQTDEKLTGVVEYPTGSGAIQEGRMDGKRLSFYTLHTPQFADQPVRIEFSGEVDNQGILLTSIYDGGVARGRAIRRR